MNIPRNKLLFCALCVCVVACQAQSIVDSATLTISCTQGIGLQGEFLEPFKLKFHSGSLCETGCSSIESNNENLLLECNIDCNQYISTTGPTDCERVLTAITLEITNCIDLSSDGVLGWTNVTGGGLIVTGTQNFYCIVCGDEFLLPCSENVGIPIDFCHLGNICDGIKGNQDTSIFPHETGLSIHCTPWINSTGPSCTTQFSPRLDNVRSNPSPFFVPGPQAFSFIFTHPMDTKSKTAATYGLFPPYDFGIVSSEGWRSPTEWRGRIDLDESHPDGVYTIRLSGTRTEKGYILPDDTSFKFQVDFATETPTPTNTATDTATITATVTPTPTPTPTLDDKIYRHPNLLKTLVELRTGNSNPATELFGATLRYFRDTN